MPRSLAVTVDPVASVDLTAYRSDGCVVVKRLFAANEVQAMLDRMMSIHAEPPSGLYAPLSVEEAKGDSLKVYPRIMHPHRFDDLSRRWLLDPRVFAILRELMGEEPLAGQSMAYFKPPQSLGQAPHQDNFYLRVQPGTCVAAWTALDRCDADNGALRVAPKTQHLDLACPDLVDSPLYFNKTTVQPPEGSELVDVVMDPGDTLFFNGSVIHGSGPNRTTNRFRRSFICHYVGESSIAVSDFYFPLLAADGREVTREVATGGGPCGDES